MLSIITPADSPDLATLAVVKAALGISDSSEDATLAALITQASSAIATACNRVLLAETVEQTFRSSGGRRGLLMTRYPVTSVVSIMEGETTLAETDYAIDTTSGIIERLISDRLACWPYGAITVRYVAGYDIEDVPPDLVQAVIMLVQQYRSQASRDPMIRAIDVTDIERQEFFALTAAGLPAPVQTLIEPHYKAAHSDAL
ncbi:MAG: phage head-tail connector protein [Xanthobacteraceae bacterium]|nr:phage head-tail connector protein [Xanthobacteraceae bacterium]